MSGFLFTFWLPFLLRFWAALSLLFENAHLHQNNHHSRRAGAKAERQRRYPCKLHCFFHSISSQQDHKREEGKIRTNHKERERERENPHSNLHSHTLRVHAMIDSSHCLHANFTVCAINDLTPPPVTRLIQMNCRSLNGASKHKHKQSSKEEQEQQVQAATASALKKANYKILPTRDSQLRGARLLLTAAPLNMPLQVLEIPSILYNVQNTAYKTATTTTTSTSITHTHTLTIVDPVCHTLWLPFRTHTQFNCTVYIH